jgi:hypothetical protein
VTDKLVCRYCGSDDLAPSFQKRRDARCRALLQAALRFGRAGQSDHAHSESEGHEVSFQAWTNLMGPDSSRDRSKLADIIGTGRRQRRLRPLNRVGDGGLRPLAGRRLRDSRRIATGVFITSGRRAPRRLLVVLWRSGRACPYRRVKNVLLSVVVLLSCSTPDNGVKWYNKPQHGQTKGQAKASTNLRQFRGRRLHDARRAGATS